MPIVHLPGIVFFYAAISLVPILISAVWLARMFFDNNEDDVYRVVCLLLFVFVIMVLCVLFFITWTYDVIPTPTSCNLCARTPELPR